MEKVTAEQILEYIDQYAASIVVRVRLGDQEGWQDLSIAALRIVDPNEAARVVGRMSELQELPRRVLVV